MPVNRKKQPDYKVIEKIKIQRAELFRLDNKLNCYVINAGSQDVIRIDLVLKAGVYYQNAPLIASTTNNMWDDIFLCLTFSTISSFSK